MQLDVRALTSTISVAVAQAVKDAMAALQANVPSTTTSPAVIGAVDQPSRSFSSIAVNLGSRVSAKIRANNWANEYIADFGTLLSVALWG